MSKRWQNWTLEIVPFESVLLLGRWRWDCSIHFCCCCVIIFCRLQRCWLSHFLLLQTMFVSFTLFPNRVSICLCNRIASEFFDLSFLYFFFPLIFLYGMDHDIKILKCKKIQLWFSSIVFFSLLSNIIKIWTDFHLHDFTQIFGFKLHCLPSSFASAGKRYNFATLISWNLFKAFANSSLLKYRIGIQLLITSFCFVWLVTKLTYYFVYYNSEKSPQKHGRRHNWKREERTKLTNESKNFEKIDKISNGQVKLDWKNILK